MGARTAGCSVHLSLPQETRVPRGHSLSPQVLRREPAGAGWVLRTLASLTAATTHSPEARSSQHLAPARCR